MTNTQKQRCNCRGEITELEIVHLSRCECSCHDVSTTNTQKQEACMHDWRIYSNCFLCGKTSQRERKEKTYTQSEVDALLAKREAEMVESIRWWVEFARKLKEENVALKIDGALLRGLSKKD